MAVTISLEAHGILEVAHGVEHERTVKGSQSLVDLYTAWGEAEPDAGHDTQTAQWRAKLPVEEPKDSNE